MSRPNTYTWGKRSAVFLDYRLVRGKVNPVANRHVMARSTVRVIVKEFEDLGFSSLPRAKVSTNLLTEMQELHLASLADSPSLGAGYSDIGPGASESEERRAALAERLPVEENFLWHLKGTKAELLIQEVNKAKQDYFQRESEALIALGLALEASCKLPERNGGDSAAPEAYLFPELTSKLRSAFFDKPFLVEPPGPDWLVWDLEPNDPKALRLRNGCVAIGSSADHQLVKEGMTFFLADGFKEHQRRFSEIERLRQDMILMHDVVGKVVEAVTADDIRLGICPACPYPEAILEADKAQTQAGAS